MFCTGSVMRKSIIKEAEKGYKKSLDLGNYELETWIKRCDILINLGEFETAIQNLFHAYEFYPETAEIEYRLAGHFFYLEQNEKGFFHLKNALKIDVEYYIIIEELFPSVFDQEPIQKIISAYKQQS